jgi:hypothetical protein
MTTLHELKGYASEALDEYTESDDDGELYLNGELGDIAHEIADGLVPVYTSDLMQLAADNINLATNEPELGAAFDGSPTPANIVAANVYEELCGEVWEQARKLDLDK